LSYRPAQDIYHNLIRL